MNDSPMDMKRHVEDDHPCEYLYAFLMAIASAVKKNAPRDELKLWRNAMLTLPVAFELLGSDSKVWLRSKELRAIHQAQQPR